MYCGESKSGKLGGSGEEWDGANWLGFQIEYPRPKEANYDANSSKFEGIFVEVTEAWGIKFRLCSWKSIIKVKTGRQKKLKDGNRSRLSAWVGQK